MNEHPTKTSKPRIQPSDEKHQSLAFTKELKERGLWPPRLHSGRDKDQHRDGKPTATPFLVIRANLSDNGSRPVPGSQAFHSPAIGIEDNLGNVIATPTKGNTYFFKCRVVNLGAFASYGGIIDFYLQPPSVYNAVAGTNASLPAFGRSGFTVLPGNFVDIKCPTPWTPQSDEELANSILVQAFDPFTDIWTSKFDARNDRHVGRHDLTSDFYVRDWTYSSGSHDTGSEPSTEPQFYVRSDVWNRRSSNAGSFVNEQPTNQDPQAGNGAAGENFMFARISRNNSSTKETVKAHFLFAEFGTGSPYIDCSNAPDPTVTFNPGETSKLISLPWHLHPSSSNHLCIAVQVYSDADPYMPPGLLGYTPGWPTTDLIVLNDNNKAQRNISVWDGVPEEAGMHFAMIFNSATFVRDFEMNITASAQTMRQFQNAKIAVQGSDQYMMLKDSGTFKVNRMMPGERRWIVFSYDAITFGNGETMQVLFNEVSDKNTLNGFALEFRQASTKAAIISAMTNQLAVFTRLGSMKIKSAEKGMALCDKILNEKAAGYYFKTLPELSYLLESAIIELSASNDGIKDSFGIMENVQSLRDFRDEKIVSKAIAHHQRLVNQLDAWITAINKSKGDEASILFTLRLQKDLYQKPPISTGCRFAGLVEATDSFINSYSIRKVTSKDYPEFMQTLSGYFKMTVELFKNKILASRLKDLFESFHGPVAGIQKAHLAFLNDLLVVQERTPAKGSSNQYDQNGYSS